jgi:uncharacterized protein (UPF0548 family)
MFSLREPTAAAIARVLAAAARRGFSYEDVGVTRGAHPGRLKPLRERGLIGAGEATYQAACAQAREWRMYQLGWTRVYPADAGAAPGTVVATVVRHLGFWSANPCQVVYADECKGDIIHSCAFAIGTLSGHAETGEERFQVEWHRADDSVWFEILAFARPRHWLARLGAPIVRRLQRRFAAEALGAMRAAVGGQAAADLSAAPDRPAADF